VDARPDPERAGVDRRDPRRLAAADERHRQAIAVLAASYPASTALLGAEARYAGFLARAGRSADARALFGRIVDANIAAGSASPALRRALAPYFELLAREGDATAAAAEMFRAAQVLIRPGVAQTQAVLARELSGGSDDAARLFRQAVSLGRDVERTRIELARAEAAEGGDPARAELCAPRSRRWSATRSRPSPGSPTFRATAPSRAGR
jgi:hypothetical protein